MTRLTWLDDATPFPDPALALDGGLLAAGGTLSVVRLDEAYRKGIFPWFNEGDPILWWSPDPRMLLSCAQFRASASLRKKLRQLGRLEAVHSPEAMKMTTDTAFSQVVQACAGPRSGAPGTWISSDLAAAYTAWHEAGDAHSIEAWIEGRLVAGLYGVCLGRFFFGESMFTRISDGSKIALAYLVNFLRVRGIQHIDCQQETPHLSSLGARPVSRERFLVLLRAALTHPSPEWGRGQILQSGQLAGLH